MSDRKLEGYCLENEIPQNLWAPFTSVLALPNKSKYIFYKLLVIHQICNKNSDISAFFYSRLPDDFHKQWAVVFDSLGVEDQSI